MLLVAGASKEAPLLVDTDGSSDSPEEAQPYVYPPHLDACRTHGDEFDVDSVIDGYWVPYYKRLLGLL